MCLFTFVFNLNNDVYILNMTRKKLTITFSERDIFSRNVNSPEQMSQVLKYGTLISYTLSQTGMRTIYPFLSINVNHEQTLRELFAQDLQVSSFL